MTLPQVSFSLAIFEAVTPIGDKVISSASAARVPSSGSHHGRRAARRSGGFRPLSPPTMSENR
jgi:hypothetical protein